jgi:hypothetical protein
MGQVFTAQYSVDEPFYLAVGTKSDKPLVVNTLDFPGVQRAFGEYLKREHATEEKVCLFFSCSLSLTGPKLC